MADSSTSGWAGRSNKISTGKEGFGGGSSVGRDVEGEEVADLSEGGEGRCSRT